MPFTIICTSCTRPLQVQEDFIGKKVRCPACQAILTVAVPATSSGPPPLPPVASIQPMAPAQTSPASVARSVSRASHEIDYEILGGEMQLVEIELDPNETVIAEAGAMTYMEDGIEFEATLGDGSAPDQGFFGKLWSAGKRAITGESMFMTHFTHRGSGKARVAFGTPYPGKIIPIDLAQMGGQIICQKDAFLCAAKGTSISIKFQKKLGAGFFGGEGFILQHLQGDGLAFMHACGCIIQRDLDHDETLRLDTGCLVAMTADIDYDIQRAGGLKSMFFAGEGLFLATLTGPGKIWMQSLPFSPSPNASPRRPQVWAAAEGKRGPSWGALAE